MPNFGTLDFAVSFSPLTAFPLDARYYFSDLESAQAAALAAVDVGSSEGTYFIGENIVVVTESDAKLYVIQPDKTLKEVGSSVLTDDKSIAISESGTLSLKDFGVQYYKYLNIIDGSWTYPDTMPSAEQGASEGAYCQAGSVWYIYTSGSWTQSENQSIDPNNPYELTQGFIDGLEPKVRLISADNFELAWYEPNPTTVEGLQSAIQSLQQTVGNMYTKDEVYTKTEIDNMFTNEYPMWGTISEQQS